MLRRLPRLAAIRFTVHVESDDDTTAVLARIRELGCRCGVVLNPDTPAAAAEPWLAEVDLVLVMTVWPGFGGQSFIESTLDKMAQLSRWRQQHGARFRLQVDGGIHLESAQRCRAHGVDTFVAGTAFFKHPDPAAFAVAIQNL
jgi:ribulose-phosphate 3-epimerase